MENWKKTFAVIWSGQLASILSSSVVAFAIIFWVSLETGSAQVLALACTEATYKDVKKARAELNKEFQDLEARRREVKKAILAPYEAFEKLYKECAADAFTKADAELKAKIDSVENSIKGAKRDEIVAFYNEYRASLNIPEDIAPFDRCGINITMSDSLKKLQGQASLFLSLIHISEPTRP